MANEITVQSGLRCANGNLCNMRVDTRAVKITQNTAVPKRIGGSPSIGTAAAGEALPITDITTNGCGQVRNCEASGGNFVEIGIQTGGTFYPLLRVNAGESYPLRFAQGIAPFARADTAAVVLEYDILDD